MPIKFLPNYTITARIAQCLMRLAAVKEMVVHLPLTPKVLASLRETVRLHITHYSTMIEGNCLEFEQVEEVLKNKGHFSKQKRDEYEVKGYYAALTQVEQWTAQDIPITENIIQTLHALGMAGGKTKVKPTPYRDGQNVIRDSRTRAIVYIPPEAKDISNLMEGFIGWINSVKDMPYPKIPCPIVAAIAHYQFATIHPYYDGNGRTARLLTTLILHLGGYDLKGQYCLEEYYATKLDAYYEALNIGKSHNYYSGRAQADITKWIEYFIEGMAVSCEKVYKYMMQANLHGSTDQSQLIRKLEPRQRKVLSLFQEFEVITSKQVGELFGFKPRTSSKICQQWVEDGFLKIVDYSNKGRKYKLAKQYRELIKQ